MSEEKEIGTVISSFEGPSPNLVDFVVTHGIVHRGQFVELDYSEGTMVCLVNDVIKTNRYFERADSVKEFESSGTKMLEQFPINEWEYLVAKTRPLGVFANGMIKRPSYPPSPGTKVRISDKENLKKFLGFDLESGLEIGSVEYHDLPVKLNLSGLLKKHLAILAMSGAGKSYGVSVLLEEILSRKKEFGRIATIVMDPHGEYSSFAEPVTEKGFEDFSDRTRLVKARNIQIGVPRLDIGLISGIIPGLSHAQKRDLGKVLSQLKQEMKDGLGPFDLAMVRSKIFRDNEIKEATKAVLIGWIDGLDALHLFGKTDNPGVADLAKPGTLTIVDLSDIIDLKKKQVIVGYFARKLFHERRNKAIPPFLFILEEAHQFVPEKAAEERAVARGIIRTIAREGRKFGASLCLISQRPVQLDTTALSQCNTHIILRITNPYDLKHIGETSEGIDARTQSMITSLRVGEAIIVGEAVSFPVFFKFRKRKSAPSKHEFSLEQAAVDFENSETQNREEAETFL